MPIERRDTVFLSIASITKFSGVIADDHNPDNIRSFQSPWHLLFAVLADKVSELRSENKISTPPQLTHALNHGHGVTDYIGVVPSHQPHSHPHTQREIFRYSHRHHEFPPRFLTIRYRASSSLLITCQFGGHVFADESVRITKVDDPA